MTDIEKLVLANARDLRGKLAQVTADCNKNAAYATRYMRLASLQHELIKLMNEDAIEANDAIREFAEAVQRLWEVEGERLTHERQGRIRELREMILAIYRERDE